MISLFLSTKTYENNKSPQTSFPQHQLIFSTVYNEATSTVNNAIREKMLYCFDAIVKVGSGEWRVASGEWYSINAI